jgi:hypothetical protein
MLNPMVDVRKKLGATTTLLHQQQEDVIAFTDFYTEAS